MIYFYMFVVTFKTVLVAKLGNYGRQDYWVYSSAC